MSKSLNPIKNAIKGLQIHKPFDLRGSNKPEFKSPPIQPPQIEHTQNEVPQNDYSQNEGAQIEDSEKKAARALVAAEDSSGGFFMLAHGIFRDSRVQKLSGDAFRLFIWMSVNAWRFKESTGELRASVGYAATGIGISKASVSRALNQLQTEGFIQLIATDYRKGNTWKVSNLALYQNQPPQFSVPQIEYTQNEDAPTSNWGSTSLKMSKHPPQNEVEYNNSLITLKNSLKNEIESETLRVHFENLKPQAKRESEQAAFESLQKDFSESEIEMAFRWVLKHGTLGEKTQPHSPMKYLAVTISEVLSLARKAQDQERVRAERENQAARVRLIEEAEIAREAVELRAIEARFLAEVPDEGKRREFIQSVAKTVPMLDAEGAVVKALALRKWCHFSIGP